MQSVADGDLTAMTGDYFEILSEYEDFAEAVDGIDEDELTAAELSYYLEVTTRVSRKLLDAAAG